ncbi:MAG: M3 family metallopeptidase [Gammaproteobacteria bacterium]|nr:M3 family metallopeptidase [Gammaproteobacteria bacterium]
MNDTSNPLMNHYNLPPFAAIRPEHVEPALDQVLMENRAAITGLVADDAATGWDRFVAIMESLDERLHRVWSPVSHLNSVMDSEALRDVYERCLPKISEYATEIAQNPKLYERYRLLADSDEFAQLDVAQRQLVNNVLREFRLNGAELEGADKARFAEIKKRLALLSNQFSRNVLDATHGWHLDIINEAELAGLPESALALARQTAERAGVQGWRFTLDAPSYLGLVEYADSRDLREQVYTAFSTRASDQGPNAGQWDNAPLIDEILQLRHEMAGLLGFANYAELSLARKMADTVSEVSDFLYDLSGRSRDVALKDRQMLEQFARQQGLDGPLQAWDIPYYGEKLRQQQYALSQEQLRPYFPLPKVLDGMFDLIGRLYGMRVEARNDVETWHDDVRFFQIYDADNQARGAFYLDCYARPHKRGGAWMDDCITRKRSGDHVQQPVAYLVCNFSPPVGSQPSLLTHDEVTTLFHEFGHGLHHMLTQVDYVSVAGINGVEWDAVELPSQFMENWCWQRDVVDSISGHYQAGDRLPAELFDKLYAARNFQSAMQLARQLEFSIFDLRLHAEYGQWPSPQALLDSVRQEVAVVEPPHFNRFQNGFSHIFGGGYAAGYYSYKWAEVLSADAFGKFEENGLFDQATGRAFLEEILERGGSQPAMELFVAFRGRKPSIDALLRHSGLAA